MLNLYFLYKSLHIISIVAWFAGLFYLPRLFVYHADAKKGGELDAALQVMERKLLRYIMNPAMIAVAIFGIALIYQVGWQNLEVWLHVKLTFVILLMLYHHYLGRIRKAFLAHKNKHSAKFYRYLNEFPSVLLIIIVFLAVFKPF